jgi:hypothetical protein
LGTFDLAGAAAAAVPVFAIASGGIGLIGAASALRGVSGPAARAVLPRDSRNSVTLLTGALRPVRIVSNQTTGNQQ